MALFAVVLLLVTDRRAHPGRLWAIPLLMVLSGPTSMAASSSVRSCSGWPGSRTSTITCRRARRVLVLAVVSVAAACITPFGPAVWAYAVGLSTNPAVTARITEWQPTSLRDCPGILFFGSALAVVVAHRPARTDDAWPTLAWLAVFFAHRRLRHPRRRLVAARCGRRDRGRPRDRPGRRSGEPSRRLRRLMRRAQRRDRRRDRARRRSPCSRSGGRSIRPRRARRASSASRRPASPRRFARRRSPATALFNPQPWGSWFEFALPTLPVAIDSRIELFPTSVWDNYDSIVSGGQAWDAQLREWGASIVVVAHEDAAFATRLSAAGWHSAFSDADGTVFVAPGR